MRGRTPCTGGVLDRHDGTAPPVEGNYIEECSPRGNADTVDEYLSGILIKGGNCDEYSVLMSKPILLMSIQYTREYVPLMSIC